MQLYLDDTRPLSTMTEAEKADVYSRIGWFKYVRRLRLEQLAQRSVDVEVSR